MPDEKTEQKVMDALTTGMTPTKVSKELGISHFFVLNCYSALRNHPSYLDGIAERAIVAASRGLDALDEMYDLIGTPDWLLRQDAAKVAKLVGETTKSVSLILGSLSQPTEDGEEVPGQGGDVPGIPERTHR